MAWGGAGSEVHACRCGLDWVRGCGRAFMAIEEIQRDQCRDLVEQGTKSRPGMICEGCSSEVAKSKAVETAFGARGY